MYASGTANRWAWYNDEIDPDVAEFVAQNPSIDDILDLGTCSGSQAIGLARMGYAVVGSDVSDTALAQAEKNAQELADLKLKLKFVHDDIVNTSFEDNRFDLILDRGCYHSICCFGHRAYVIQLKRILRPKGTLLLKTMSSKESRFSGYETIDGVTFQMPYKFDADKLREMFSAEFEVVDIRDSYFYSTVTNPPARAMLSILMNRK